jgi:demethoxyubiquinone hydroxylase (CLK1/Coq7/Cat5 family)
MINLTSSVSEAVLMVGILAIMAGITTTWRFFQKPKFRFFMETMGRVMVFLFIMVLLNKYPVFRSLVQEKEVLVRKGKSPATFKKAAIDMAVAVNTAGAALIKSATELSRGSRVVAVTEADRKKLQEMEERVATMLAVFNEGAARVLNTTKNETIYMISPLAKEVNITALLLGKKNETALVLKDTWDVALYDADSRIQQYVKKNRQKISRELITTNNKDQTQIIIARLDEETKRSAAIADTVGEVGKQMLDEFIKLSAEVERTQAARVVGRVQQLTRQQYMKQKEGTILILPKPPRQQQEPVQHGVFDSVLGYFNVPIKKASKYIKTALKELTGMTEGDAPLQEVFYNYASTLFSQFPDLHPGVSINAANMKIAELLATTRNAGDYIKKTMFVFKAESKRQFENVAASIAVSIAGDEVFFLIKALLVLLYKVPRRRRAPRNRRR